MRATPILVAIAVSLAFAAAPALGASATVEGECKDAQDSGGGGSVGASSDSPTEPNLVTEEEAESILAGLEDLDDGSCDENAELRATVGAQGEEESVGYGDLQGLP